MKVISPAVTCVLTSHMKSLYLRASIESVLAQTRRDFQILLIDSGQWIGSDHPERHAMAGLHEIYSQHPLIDWVTTGEGPDIRSRKCPVAWVFNETIRSGLVRGRYVCTFYDDDLYYPEFMEKMAGFLDAHPAAKAVYSAQNRVSLTPDGGRTVVGLFPANFPRPGGSFCGAVDGAQIMFRRTLLDEIGDPWMDEDNLGNCHQSDGAFMDKLGTFAGIVPNIPDVLGEHRFTKISAYHPS